MLTRFVTPAMVADDPAQAITDVAVVSLGTSGNLQRQMLRVLHARTNRSLPVVVLCRAHCPDQVAIRIAWLGVLLSTGAPQLVDRASGEPLMLVEDDYDVHDAGALAAALAACDDVLGDACDGWTRGESAAGDVVRPLTSINATDSPNRVTLFHRTLAGADAGRSWFESVAAGVVSHRTRRVTDPVDALRADDRIASRNRFGAATTTELSRAGMGPFFEQVIRRTYANWCDEPIPALDGKTPRQCLDSANGRERVRFLLRTYEQSERRLAGTQGRAPVSYDFLWQDIRLARKE